MLVIDEHSSLLSDRLIDAAYGLGLGNKDKEALLKGKAQRSQPPCPNQFRSAHFYIESIIYPFYKTVYLKEEVNCTELFSLSKYSLDKHSSLV
jgi:hypothetical protein